MSAAAVVEPVVLGMTDEVYHSRPELSSSGARMLLPEYKGSPQKFRYQQTHRRESRAFDIGHAAHAKVLGIGASIVVYPDEHLTPSGNVSTKAATLVWEAEQRALGLTPVSPGEVARVDAMAEAILNHPTARPYLEVAVGREVSVFGTVDGVACRARFDGLSDETRRGVIAVDLKTTDDATENGFTYSVKKYGYDVQEAWYRDVYEAATSRTVDEFVLIAVEKAAPHEVSVNQLPMIWTSMGRRKATEARRLFRQCTETGVWPGYSPEVQILEPPAWAVIEHEMRYDPEVEF